MKSRQVHDYISTVYLVQFSINKWMSTKNTCIGRIGDRSVFGLEIHRISSWLCWVGPEWDEDEPFVTGSPHSSESIDFHGVRSWWWVDHQFEMRKQSKEDYWVDELIQYDSKKNQNIWWWADVDRLELI